jgi:hypothetical protein
VAAWFEGRAGDLGTIAQHWYARMRRCGPDVRELVHDGCPVVCVEAAPFAYVNVFRSHVGVGFFHGADLPDPAGLLEGAGKQMRHVKLRSAVAVAVDTAALDALVGAAYGDILARLKQSGEGHVAGRGASAIGSRQEHDGIDL